MRDRYLDDQTLLGLRVLQRDSGGRVFHEVLELYLSSGPVLIGEMETRLGRGEYAELSRLAHRLEVDSCLIGATRLTYHSRLMFECLEKILDLDPIAVESGTEVRSVARLLRELQADWDSTSRLLREESSIECCRASLADPLLF